MKWLYSLPFLLFIYACSNPAKESPTSYPTEQDSVEVVERYTGPKKQVDSSIQTLMDDLLVRGCVLIYDEEKNTYASNNFDNADSVFLPASTFKIPNSIIQLENGNVKNLRSIQKWNGEKRHFAFWEKDMTFREAYHKSCLPCYQELALQTGFEGMAQAAENLGFGHMKFDSTDHHRFWVRGSSRISAMQQIDFLQRLQHKELEISDRTYGLMRRLMVLDSTAHHVLRGKTGWSVSGGRHVGWYVGFVENENGTFYFATNIQAMEGFDRKKFAQTRIDLSWQVLENYGILKRQHDDQADH